MGLLYLFPCKENENTTFEKDFFVLKSYGLPPIFWLYFGGVLFIVSLMSFAIYNPALKLAKTGDPLNLSLVFLVLLVLVGTPISLLLFFLYEKRISKNGKQLHLSHCLLGIKIKNCSYVLKRKDSFKIQHFLSSPNIARMKKDPSTRAFENQGYWELHAELEDGRFILVDRNGRKADLKKMVTILSDH